MSYNFNKFEEKIENTTNRLKEKYSGIRTGRANPAILDGINVELYGSMLPINQSATISIEDARTIRITPWDKNNLKIIEKAIVDSNIDLAISDDGESVRISFPELTSERREQLVKILKEKMEDARVSIRGHRDEVWSDIKKMEKDGEISEDDKFSLKDKMEEITEDANKNLEEITKKKEEDIRK